MRGRLVYGGHVISLVRALSFNGLGNAGLVVGLNGGRHSHPCLAGDTVYAWSEILDKAQAPGRSDVGFLRLRTVGLKNTAGAGFPDKDGDGQYPPHIILDLDYWVALPR
jgi:2-methylfumaryl-CoA hydratase